MTIEVGKISVKVSMDSAGFERGSKAIKEETKDIKKGTKSLDDSVRASAKEFAKWGAAVAAAAGTAAGAIVSNSLKSIKELQKQASVAGLTVSELQRGAFAAQQFGIEQDKYSDILKDVNDKMGQFLQRGSGPMVDFFESIAPKIGITANEFRGLSSQEVLGRYIKALEDANLSQEDMTFWLEALANDATALAPLFKNNAREMKAMESAAKDLNIGLSELEVKNAIEAQNSLEQLGAVIGTQVNKAVAELSPVITDLSERFAKTIGSSTTLKNALVTSFKAMATAGAVFANGIRGLQMAFKALEVAVTGAMGFIVKRFSGAAQSVTDIINSLVSFITDALKTVLKGWSEIFGGIGNMMKRFGIEGADAFDFLASGADDLANSMQALELPPVDKQVEALASAYKSAKEELKEMVDQKLPTEVLAEQFAETERLAAAHQEALKKINAGETEEEDKPDKKTGGAVLTQQKTFDMAKFEEETQAMLKAQEQRDLSLQAQNLLHLQELESQFLAHIGETEQFEAQKQRLAEITANAQKELAVNSLKETVSALATNSKKALAIQKAFGVAEAVVNIAQGITKAQTLPTPANIFEAARIAAVGAAQIRSIKSASPGGGSAPSAGAGGAGGAAPSGAGAGAGVQEGGPSRVFNVDLTGSSNISNQQARNLLEMFNEQIGDGVEINVKG